MGEEYNKEDMMDFMRFCKTNIGFCQITDEGMFVKWIENKNKAKAINKAYEILSFRMNKNAAYPGTIWTRNANGKFGVDTFWASESQMLELSSNQCSNPCSNREIYSVKRLSDGVIFTMGDVVNQGGTIIGFTIYYNEFLVRVSKGGIKTQINFQELTRKNLIFLFHDYHGNKIYVNDTFWVVYKDKYSVEKSVALSASNEKTYGVNFKYKKDAEEYAMLHKPTPVVLQMMLDFLKEPSLKDKIIDFFKEKQK